jgi:hypothetical protein
MTSQRSVDLDEKAPCASRPQSHKMIGLSAADLARSLVDDDRQITAVQVVHTSRVQLQRKALIRDTLASHYARQSEIRNTGASSVQDACALLQVAARTQRVGSTPSLWEAVLREVLERPDWVDTVLFRAAGSHDREEDRFAEVNRSAVLNGDLLRQAASPETGEMVVLMSRVKLSNGVVAHIPMLDFGCPDTPNARMVLPHVLAQLGEAGALVASGASFHFYGFRLMTDPERIRFLARALLYHPIVDGRYIAHSLLEPASSLRLSRHEQTNEYPHVIDVIAAA